MRSPRTVVRLTFCNWLSGPYLGLACLLLLVGAGDDGNQPAGLLALLLTAPTGAVLIGAVNSAGPGAQGDAAIWIALAVSYLFQAFLLGLLARAVRRGLTRARGGSAAGDLPAVD
ncbi:SCO4225 family membrane protein [Streptomyces sp. NPDC057939]|uniref:SCO4225 family membrane protein n=1 Tax=Streptomyces sp. NPDC057939 TaxID=3346284 RepID=UPI0036EA9AEF